MHINANFCFAIYLHFFLHFALYDICKCGEMRCQWVLKDYISRLQTSLVQFISDDIAKTKLSISTFLYCGEFVKISHCAVKFKAVPEKRIIYQSLLWLFWTGSTTLIWVATLPLIYNDIHYLHQCKLTMHITITTILFIILHFWIWLLI